LSERRSLLEWFSKRRETVVMKGVRDHLRSVGDSVAELNKSVAALTKNDRKGALDALSRMMLSEKEADNIEEAMSDELSKGDMGIEERENLMRLVRRVDDIADWAKEAEVNLQLILEAEVKVPTGLWARYSEMTAVLEKAPRELLQAVESLGIDWEKANARSREVERLERVMDDMYFQIKKEILFSDTDPRAVFLLRDMLHGIENSADSCKEVADSIHVILITDAHKAK